MDRIATFSPDSLCSQGIEGHIARNKGDAFDQALRRQHAVEWITVLAEQSTRSQRMKVTDRQMAEPIKGHQFVKTSNRIAPDVQFSQAILGGNLPCTGCTDQELVGIVLNQLPYSGWKCRIIRPPP